MTSPGTLFFVFLLAFQVVVYGVMYWIQPWLPESFLRFPLFNVVMFLLILLLPLYIWLALRKEKLSTFIPSVKLGRTNSILILAISFFLLPFMAFLSAISSMFLPNVAADFLTEMSQHSIWVLLFVAAVTPAVVEEVVFRGYIQSQYKTWVFWRVALLNGFFFAFIHAPQQWLYAFAMGVVMAYMVHITRSVRAGILSHFFMNAINVIMFRGVAWLYARQEEVEREAVAHVVTISTEAAEITTAITTRPLSPYVPTSMMMMARVLAVCLVFLPFLIITTRTFISHNRQRFTEYDIRQALADESDDKTNDESDDSDEKKQPDHRGGGVEP